MHLGQVLVATTLALAACGDSLVIAPDVLENKVTTTTTAAPNLRAAAFTVKDDDTTAKVMIIIDKQDGSEDVESATNSSKFYDFTQVDEDTSLSDEDRALIPPAFRELLKTAVTKPSQFIKSVGFLGWMQKIYS